MPLYKDDGLTYTERVIAIDPETWEERTKKEGGLDLSPFNLWMKDVAEVAYRLGWTAVRDLFDIEVTELQRESLREGLILWFSHFDWEKAKATEDYVRDTSNQRRSENRNRKR